ncbi:hypothetical protein DB88DRAFT_500649 [Papiliotrema laurentii]|uniref:Uncharacterized protein n=1 Tax=Papiliotrema laurentii TaxID=5418 RepID=A0AAD9FM30_PAPLA|nr:hypothetical protein DB88DRAFT_500649 [Papiliotrema laurentii]
MSTQNLNIGPLRSSGHKEATEEHAEVAHLSTRGENGDPKALLQNRLLNNPQVLRAALYDHDDFLPVASSTKQFDLSPDLVRKILDGLLTYSRVGDPTAAGGAGQPPQGLNLGNEGHVTVKNGDADKIVGELKGHVRCWSLPLAHRLTCSSSSPPERPLMSCSSKPRRVPTRRAWRRMSSRSSRDCRSSREFCGREGVRYANE